MIYRYGQKVSNGKLKGAINISKKEMKERHRSLSKKEEDEKKMLKEGAPW